MGKSDRVFQTVIFIILLVLSICSIFPFIILVSASFSDEMSIMVDGYGIIPKVFSLEAYRYIADNFAIILNSYGITAGVTITGTVVSVLMTAMLAYPISRSDLPGKFFFRFMIVLTILFNGGLIPTYLVYTQFFHLKNSILALIIPNLLMNGFSVTLMRNYYTYNTPKEIIEAAEIDGAGEGKIFWKIVLPISKPMLATIGLMCGMAYWNDWNNGLVYITDLNKLGIQNYLYKIITEAQMIAANSNLSSNTSSLPIQTVRMAISFTAVGPLIIAYLFLQEYFVQGMTMGAVKG